MIRVDQTLFGGDSNCVGACVASVLEVPSADVPHFGLHGDWSSMLNMWLAARDLWFLSVPFRRDGTPWIGVGWHLMIGEGPRGACHTVVGFSGEIVHDPHPSRDGLTAIDTCGFFVRRFVMDTIGEAMPPR